LPTRELGEVIGRSKLVLARSGYSTAMDLVRMGKKAIYIPTPGQPEQEYLGRYLEEQGLGVCMRQRGFVLAEAIRRSEGLTDGKVGGKNDLLGLEIRRVVAQSGVPDLG
jgi:UDP-N-acetylglucosamine:LPS N-acetylglucosamine transferase